MKIPHYALFLLFFLFTSSSVYAESQRWLIDSIYFVELFIMGAVSLALIFVFILMLNERGQRVKKISHIFEELDQKMSIMQMMMNSVREKEQNIIKIAQEKPLRVVDSSMSSSEDILLETSKERENEKQEAFVDPRTLDVNGKVKQPHLGRENYLIAMRAAHSQSLSRVVAIDDALQGAITNAVNMSDNNVQEIDSFYQNLSELIRTLELDHGIETIKSSSRHMIEALSDIQDDFETLMKQQKYNQSAYEGLSTGIVEKSYDYPDEVVTAVLEK